MTNEEAIKVLSSVILILPTGCSCVNISNEFKEAYSLAIKALENKPKKGKWKKRHETSYECPFCGEENYYAYDEVLDKFNDNFCPNCGADLREEATNG